MLMCVRARARACACVRVRARVRARACVLMLAFPYHDYYYYYYYYYECPKTPKSFLTIRPTPSSHVLRIVTTDRARFASTASS